VISIVLFICPFLYFHFYVWIIKSISVTPSPPYTKVWSHDINMELPKKCMVAKSLNLFWLIVESAAKSVDVIT